MTLAGCLGETESVNPIEEPTDESFTDHDMDLATRIHQTW